MRRVLLGLCFLVPCFVLAAGSALAQDQASITRERSRLLARINAYRAEHGAPALRASATLQRAAEGHSADMASRGYFDHETPEGRSPVDRARAAGYPSGFVGENLAAGHAGADATFEQWRNSPAHDRGMRDPRYHAVGLGYVARPGSPYRHYWTMVMGDRVDVPAADGAAVEAPAPPVAQPGTQIPTLPPPGSDDDVAPDGRATGDCAWGGCEDDCEGDECQEEDDDDWQPGPDDYVPDAPTATPGLPPGWLMGPFGFPVPAIPGLTVPGPATTTPMPGAATPAPMPGATGPSVPGAPTTPAIPAAPTTTAPARRPMTIDVNQLFMMLQQLGVVGAPQQ